MPPLAVIVVLAFATYRLTRLFTADRITDPLRDAFFNWAYKPLEGDEREAWLVLHKQADTIPSHVPRGWEIRTWVYDLVTCDQCLGVWWAAAIYTAYAMRFDLNTDVVAAVLSVAAICGFQSLIAWVVDVLWKTSKQLDD